MTSGGALSTGRPWLADEEARGLALLAQGNRAVIGTLEEVVARQRESVRMHARAQRSLSALPSQLPYASPLLPLCVSEAQGARIVDADGHEYVDCHMTYTAGILGHNPRPVVEAVRRALASSPGAGFLFEEQVELGELVQRMVPGLERVAFMHSGADAVAAAVRMARAGAAAGRVAKFEGCYHGWSDLALHNPMIALTGRFPSDPLDRIAPHAATGGVSTSLEDELLILPYNSAVAFDLIRAHARELSCVVADPCPPFMAEHPGAAEAFVRELRDVTAEAGVVLVLDEVVSGFRLARGGAQEAYGVSADIAAYAKVTSGLGIPLSIVGGRAEQLDRARTDGLFADYGARKAWTTTTHAAGPPAVSAGLAALQLLDGNFEAIADALDRNHRRLSEGLARVATQTGVPVAVSGHPRLQSYIVLGHPRAGGADYRSAIASTGLDDLRAMLLLTLYLRLEGVYAKTAPTANLSWAHTDADVDHVIEAVRRSVLRMAHDCALAP